MLLTKMNLILFKTLSYILILFVANSQAGEPNKEVSPFVKDLDTSETCPKVWCTKSPADLTCNKTEITNPSVISQIGSDRKSCCSAFQCSEKDGSSNTYYGITGEDISNDVTSNNVTPKGICSLVTCPKPIESDATCKVSKSADANDFKPKGEVQNCCPLYNCTVDEEGTYRTRFVLTAGNIPKDPAVISKEKGTPTSDQKCPAVKCTTKPIASGCEATFQNFSNTLLTLGPFKDCCPLWKCTFPDGSYFTHFGDSKTPEGRRLEIRPAPGLPQGRGFDIIPAAAPVAKEILDATTNAPMIQKQEIKILNPPPKGKKGGDDDEDGEDEGDDEEEPGKSSSISQTQGGGSGNGQQEQKITIQEAAKKKPKPTTTTTTTTTSKGLLGLNLGALGLG